MLSRQWGDDESTNLVKQFTFTIGLDDLAILVRVNPVFPVSHLVPFTRFNLTTGFRRKFFDGSEGNYVRKHEFQERSLHHHNIYITTLFK